MRFPISPFSPWRAASLGSWPLPSTGRPDAHAEGGLLRRDQREAERVRETERERKMERGEKDRENQRGTRKSEGGRRNEGERGERSSPWFV